MCRCSESIHNYPNGIVAGLSTMQTDNEIHGDVFLLPFQFRQRLKSSCRFLMFCLHLLAHETFGYKFCYVFLHTRPPIIFFDGSVDLGTTRVHSISRTMGFFHNSFSQIINIRHTNLAFHHQDLILKNPKFFSNIPIYDLMHFFYQLIILHLLASNLINQSWSHHKACYQCTIIIIIQAYSQSLQIQQQRVRMQYECEPRSLKIFGSKHPLQH